MTEQSESKPEVRFDNKRVQVERTKQTPPRTATTDSAKVTKADAAELARKYSYKDDSLTMFAFNQSAQSVTIVDASESISPERTSKT